MNSGIRVLIAVICSVLMAGLTWGQSHDDLGEWTIRVGGVTQQMEARPMALAKGRILFQDASGGRRIVALEEIARPDRKKALLRAAVEELVKVAESDQ